MHAIETNQPIEPIDEISIQKKREAAESIIQSDGKHKDLGGHVNSDIVKVMAESESQKPDRLNNWILDFDWNDGNFVLWDIVSRNTDEAIAAYSRYEKQFPEEDKYEVVLIGTSDIATVPQTHSHYFGIEHHNEALEAMENSIIGWARRSELDVGARRILFTLKRRQYWGKNSIKVSTLRNHFCQSVATFDKSLSELRTRGLVQGEDPISLDIKKSKEINSFT